MTCLKVQNRIERELGRPLESDERETVTRMFDAGVGTRGIIQVLARIKKGLWVV